jgi:C1A family cysteine protease
MKNGYLLLLISLLMCSMNTAFAAEPASKELLPSVAPLNPAFVNYIEKMQLENGALSQPSDGTLFGYIPSPVDYSHLRTSESQVLSLSLPSSFDLRPLNRLTPVRDQGSYGTCWAHATMASLESCTRSRTGDIFDFSENNLINLNGFDWNTWWGGNATIATAYFTRWNGPVLEASDPYPHPGESSALPPAQHLVNVLFLPSRSGATDNTAIKQAITNYGAVMANYFHDDSYKAPTHGYYYPGGLVDDGANHAIALVGWNDNYSHTNFNHTPPGDGAFIVKNSWGTWWGEAGYFYISYYDIRLAYNEVSVFYDLITTNTYRKVYQYDPLGKVASVGYGTTSWGANIFTATGNDIIGAVGFYAGALNTTNTIYIYKNVTAGQPCSGTLVTNLTVSSAEAGYVTALLPTPVYVATNTRFSVVMKLTTPGYSYPLAYECPAPGYSSAATASSGQSYMGSNGSSWQDMATWNSANFCAKAYVFNETPVITGASVTSVLGVPHFQIEYTGIKGITNRVQHKVALTNLTWSSVRTNVPSYTGIQTNQIPVQTNSGVYRISLP